MLGHAPPCHIGGRGGRTDPTPTLAVMRATRCRAVLAAATGGGVRRRPRHLHCLRRARPRLRRLRRLALLPRQGRQPRVLRPGRKLQTLRRCALHPRQALTLRARPSQPWPTPNQGEQRVSALPITVSRCSRRPPSQVFLTSGRGSFTRAGIKQRCSGISTEIGTRARRERATTTCCGQEDISYTYTHALGVGSEQ